MKTIKLIKDLVRMLLDFIRNLILFDVILFAHGTCRVFYTLLCNHASK